MYSAGLIQAGPENSCGKWLPSQRVVMQGE